MEIAEFDSHYSAIEVRNDSKLFNTCQEKRFICLDPAELCIPCSRTAGVHEVGLHTLSAWIDVDLEQKAAVFLRLNAVREINRHWKRMRFSIVRPGHRYPHIRLQTRTVVTARTLRRCHCHWGAHQVIGRRLCYSTRRWIVHKIDSR
jgi:hypothetical protein